MAEKVPDYGPRMHRRLKGALAANTAVTNGTAVQEVIPIHGSAKVSVRILTGSGDNGSLQVIPLMPTYDPEQDTTAALQNAKAYTTGLTSATAVTGATEALHQYTGNGERYALVRFTPTADGVISWVDVSDL